MHPRSASTYGGCRGKLGPIEASSVACIVDFEEGSLLINGEVELDSPSKAHATTVAFEIGPSAGTYVDSTSFVFWASCRPFNT